MQNLSIIACISRDRGLGRAGQLLWQIPEDMKFFRQTTLNSTVIMGRKTYESIGRPLPQRHNIVLSRQTIPGVVTYCSKTELDAFLATTPGPKFIIGGSSLYQMYLNEADRVYLTEVDATQPADVYFPEFNPHKYSRKLLQTGAHEGIQYQIVEYTRR